MREIPIKQIGVDDKGRLSVIPDLGPHEDFELIYRTAMGVSWTAKARGLRSPKLRPGGWTYAEWFQQIQRATADEYAVKLVINADTTWAVPEEVRRQIEADVGARGDLG